ncbi:MAG: cation-transporting P-type ATPase [SAR202 cluster bacterium]|nr:cation-transporting P-type ATPase [SAR202 cluster bacterium]
MTTGTDLPWHARPMGHILFNPETAQTGLSTVEAARRLEVYGPNRLIETPPVAPLTLLLREFRSFLVLILLAAAILLFAVGAVDGESGQYVDATLILLIVVFNGALGFVQNYRAQRGIEALKRLSAPIATYLRDGRVVTGDTSALTPGDVVLLEEGDRVAADGRLIEAYDLRVDESGLTGESLPTAKQLGLLDLTTNLAERSNMVYMSTVVLRGRAKFVVTATGMATEVGKIAAEIQSVEVRPTAFQLEIDTLGKRITTMIALLIAVIVVLQVAVSGFTLLETFVSAVALAVAAIPEGLPVVLTLALAFGTRRMLDRHALVRSLPFVEIVGGADVICTDKTGTITEGRMSLRLLDQADGRVESIASISGESRFLDENGSPVDQSENLALLASGLCNNATYDSVNGLRGDPTETALLEGAIAAGVDLGTYSRVHEIPFNSERKMMSVVVQRDGRAFVFAKGAPEVLVPRCSGISRDGGVVSLTPDGREDLLAKNGELAAQALRMLALAYKELPASHDWAANANGPDQAPAQEENSPLEQDLVFLGLAGISDPPRAEVASAVQVAHSAGIRIVMITGDNRATALAVAHDVGLEGGCLEGRDLENMDTAELDRAVRECGIFARAEPRHKLRILRSLQEQGHVVVMTGDGVNDAPALKGADVGIAMGIRGTEVAKDASGMVLMDDNFATILAAVEEGRRIFANIKKFVNYLLIGNFAEVLVVLVASLFGYLPITAVQILWINLVTDSGPAVALGIDPAAPGIMQEPPRHGGVITRGMYALILSIGVVKAGIILGSFFLGVYFYDLQTAQTMTFTAFVIQEYLRLGVIRYQERSPLLSNGWLVGAVAVSLGLQLVLVYSPVGAFLDLTPLGVAQWLILLGGLAFGIVTALTITNQVIKRVGPI